MPHTLPNSRHERRHQQGIKHTLHDQRRALQVVPIDINAHEAADRATDRHDKQPIPLDPSPQGPPAAVHGQVASSVLARVDEREEDAEREEEGEGEAEGRVLADVVDGRVAGGAVHDGAVLQEEVGFEGLEDEVAFGAVGERAVCVERVVVPVEGGAVEMHAVDEDVGVVGAGLEGRQGPGE